MKMFEKYVNLIRSKAWFYAKKTGIDFEEIEAQGYLIYCQCLENYDVTKADFSTHLYIELGRLKDFCKTYQRQKGKLLDDQVDSKGNPIPERTLTRDYDLPQQESILKFAKENLSLDALSLLVWILSRAWEDFHKTKPTYTDMQRHFSEWKNIRLRMAYNEVKHFWKYQLQFVC